MAAGCHWITTARYQLALLSFFGFVSTYMLRVNLSVALVAMVATNDTDESNNTECYNQSIVNGTSTSIHETTPFPGATYDWDRDTQGLILGSFFYGYIVTQIPGGWLAGKYGGKKVFGFSILCSAVFTLLTPLAAHLGVPALVAIRLLEGLSGGFTLPAMHAMWAVWAPPLERSKLVTLSYAGAEFGTVIGLALTGWIADEIGWQYVFYIFGGIGIVWFVIWMILVSDTPDKHKYISDAEKEYIVTEISKHTSPKPITLSNTPWLEFLKSPAVWAIACVHFCHNWGFYTLLTCLPTYMKDVLHFDLSKDSLISSLPYIFMWLFIPITGFIIDTAREKRIMSTTFARKLVNTVGFMVPAACLTGTGFVGCDTTLAVVLLCIAGAFDGISQCCFSVNHLDIAPKYAGTLMGITNTIAAIPGFLGPQVVGWITTTNSTSEQWRSVFFISAEIYVFGVIIYCVLGSGTLQPWATDDTRYEPLPSENSTDTHCDYVYSTSINNYQFTEDAGT